MSAREEIGRVPKAVQTRGHGGMLPQKMFKFRVSGINRKENAVVSCLFYLSLVLSVGKAARARCLPFRWAKTPI